jgi:hypothetical protein
VGESRQRNRRDGELSIFHAARLAIGVESRP